MTPQESDRVTHFRALNDAFRKAFVGGKMAMTASVASPPEMVKASCNQ